MAHEFIKLVLETCGVLALIGAAILLLRRWRGSHVDARAVVGGTLAALTLVFALSNVHGAGSALNQARRNAVGATTGLEHCLHESNGEGGRLLPLRWPFVTWLKRRLPAHAVYTLAPYSGPPDPWCVGLVLLPALPAGPGGSPGWTIAFGTVPADLKARIARHDPSVQVFARGFALARNSGP